MNTYLIGFMGSGKTYWGRIWAEAAQVPFCDLDELIEAKEKMTIDAIFEKKGEAYFRKIESELLRSTLSSDNSIIACGGGTPCFDSNIQWMNQNGTTIYLEASPKKLFDIILPEVDKRPLLKKVNRAEMLFFIEQKLTERLPFYQLANHTWPIDSLNNNSFQNFIHPIHHA